MKHEQFRVCQWVLRGQCSPVSISMHWQHRTRLETPLRLLRSYLVLRLSGGSV